MVSLALCCASLIDAMFFHEYLSINSEKASESKVVV